MSLPICRVEDHRWLIRCEAGSIQLECIDPHSKTELEQMEPYSVMPGCLVEAENLIAEFGPCTLKWETEQHGWEYPGEYDAWVTVIDHSVPVV